MQRTQNTEDSVAVTVVRSSRRRIVLTVVNLCALVNGGKHLFFFARVLGGVLLFVAVGGVFIQISKGVPFFGAVDISRY